MRRHRIVLMITAFFILCSIYLYLSTMHNEKSIIIQVDEELNKTTITNLEKALECKIVELSKYSSSMIMVNGSLTQILGFDHLNGSTSFSNRKPEIILGKSALESYPNIKVTQEIELDNVKYTVVGINESFNQSFVSNGDLIKNHIKTYYFVFQKGDNIQNHLSVIAQLSGRGIDYQKSLSVNLLFQFPIILYGFFLLIFIVRRVTVNLNLLWNKDYSLSSDQIFDNEYWIESRFSLVSFVIEISKILIMVIGIILILAFYTDYLAYFKYPFFTYESVKEVIMDVLHQIRFGIENGFLIEEQSFIYTYCMLFLCIMLLCLISRIVKRVRSSNVK